VSVHDVEEPLDGVGVVGAFGELADGVEPGVDSREDDLGAGPEVAIQRALRDPRLMRDAGGTRASYAVPRDDADCRVDYLGPADRPCEPRPRSAGSGFSRRGPVNKFDVQRCGDVQVLSPPCGHDRAGGAGM
jgi:hypothetical protein